MDANDNNEATNKIVRMTASLPRVERDDFDGLTSACKKIDPKIKRSEVVRIGLKRLKDDGAGNVSAAVSKLSRFKPGKKKLSKSAFHEITDEEWEELETILKRHGLEKKSNRVGKPDKFSLRDDLNGALYYLKKKCTYREVPASYGSPSTLTRTFKKLDQKILNEIYDVFFERLKKLDYEKKLEIFRLLP